MYTWLGVKIMEGDLGSGKKLLNVVLVEAAGESYLFHSRLRSWNKLGSSRQDPDRDAWLHSGEHCTA